MNQLRNPFVKTFGECSSFSSFVSSTNSNVGHVRLVTMYWPVQDPAQILPFDHASGPSSAVGNSSSVVVDSTGARAYLLAESSLSLDVT